MSDDGLHIHRPIPRRPFELAFSSPTPPADYDDDDSPPASPNHRTDFLENDHQIKNDLDPHAFNAPIDSSSRAGSYQYLMSSTLSGIHSPNLAGGFEEEEVFGVNTPRRGKMEDSIYKLVKDRSSQVARRRSSTMSANAGKTAGPSFSRGTSALSLLLRTGLLFLLGMGYGALLLRLSTEQQWAAFPVEGMLRIERDGRYLAAWGLCGVVLGSLLPWFDGKWEEIFERGNGSEDEEAVDDDGDPGTDWALVVRGVGAFAGILFAIRKVPWASTMQVSLTLATANPLLWYLIDRSKTGFLLSAAVGLAGTIVLLGLNPEIMPAPTSFAPASYLDDRTNATGGGDPALMLGGMATQRTVEKGIWVISVLFCSCVCFGNIGRRLALNRSAVGRGRWGGLR